LAIVRRLDVPLLLHTGQLKECHAAVFDSMIATHPDITFVLAHGRPVGEACELLKKYENVYVDTAFMSVGEIVHLVKNDCTDRILFGTDAPINLVYYKDVGTADYLKITMMQIRQEIGDDLFRQLSERNIYNKNKRTWK